MAAFIDVQVQPKCWNLIDSYGMICVGCGCCSNDKQIRYKARIKTLEAWLEEQYNFDMWDDEWVTIAEQQNNKTNNIVFSVDGERKTASQVAREAGVKPATVHQWLRRGMSKEDVLNRLNAI